MTTSVETLEYIAPDNASYVFDSSTRFTMSTTGTGMPTISYMETQAYDQHGSSYYDYRLQRRTIQIVHRVNSCSRDNYWDNRYTLVDMLRPNRQVIGCNAPGKLRFTFGDGSMKQIDVFIEQGPVFEPRDLDRWDEWGFAETLRFSAPDPTFYDPIVHTVDYSYNDPSQITDHLVFPFTFNGLTDLMFMSYGTYGIGLQSNTINYVGNWRSFPTFTLVGPMESVILQNVSTGKEIRLTHSIGALQSVVIDLNYSARTVVDNLGNNLMSYISPESDFTTFAIEPDPTVAGGANVITLAFEGAVLGTTSATMTYYDRYVGF